MEDIALLRIKDHETLRLLEHGKRFWTTFSLCNTYATLKFSGDFLKLLMCCWQSESAEKY